MASEHHVVFSTNHSWQPFARGPNHEHVTRPRAPTHLPLLNYSFVWLVSGHWDAVFIIKSYWIVRFISPIVFKTTIQTWWDRTTPFSTWHVVSTSHVSRYMGCQGMLGVMETAQTWHGLISEDARQVSSRIGYSEPCARRSTDGGHVKLRAGVCCKPLYNILQEHIREYGGDLRTLLLYML